MNLKPLLAVTLATISLSSQAGIIVGGSNLLDDAGLSQLQAWLGQGDLQLTNIFTKTTGSTGVDFHSAADNKGPTFTLMSASETGGAWKIVGGYEQRSWDSANIPHGVGPYPSEWTSFIFNLTDSVKKAEDNGFYASTDATSGPAFGAGSDLYVDPSLSTGYSFGYSYGDACILNPDNSVPVHCGYDFGRSIVDESLSYNADGRLGSDGMDLRIGALEVFSIASYTAPPPSNQVPEPSATALIGMGLLGLALGRRRKNPTT